ncbi:hypothetical protein D3C87_1764340 [compost metagenome]
MGGAAAGRLGVAGWLALMSDLATGIRTAARTTSPIAASAAGLTWGCCGLWILRRIFSSRWATLSSTSVTAWQ